MNDMQEASGTIWAVFGHRFAIEGKEGRFLADLGPKGAEGIELKVGDADGKHAHEPADPAAAIAAVRGQGYAVEGDPRRKPKHFEIVGSRDGARHEIHVELDGKIRKTKPLAA